MINILKYLKYLVYGISVYLLISFIPRIKLPTSDKVVVASILMISFTLLDILLPKKKLMVENYDKCNTASVKFPSGNGEYISMAGYAEDNVDTENLLDSEKENDQKENDQKENELLNKLKEQDDKIKALEQKLKNQPTRVISTCKTELKEDSDMKYSELNKESHKPLGEFTDDFNNDFEYGYSYLNTNKWKIPMQKPPVCKTEKTCPICPITTVGYPVDVKHWNKSKKVLPPDNINIKYIDEKLNK